MPRSLPEWIGKTDDTPVPERVKLRVFEKHGGICHRSGVKLRPGHWATDHIIAIIDGGENRESNLAPISTVKVRVEGADGKVRERSPHDEKTAEEVRRKSKVYRQKKKDLGLRKPKGRPMPGTRASGIRKRMNRRVERW